MSFARYLAFQIGTSLLACLAAGATNLVTGNGFGFAVVSPQTAMISKFYAHPYSFARPDPQNPLAEGVETTNFIKNLGWSGPATQGASAEYEEDSHVIHTRSNGAEGFFFMPFGLREPALVIIWEPASASASPGRLDVEWIRPVKSHTVARVAGIEIELLKFDGVEESLLLIPLGPKRPEAAPGQQNLASRLAWALVSLE